MLRKFTTLCSPLPCVEEKVLQLSQRSVMGVARPSISLKIPSIPSVSKVIHCREKLITCYIYIAYMYIDQENSEHAVCVIASKSFCSGAN